MTPAENAKQALQTWLASATGAARLGLRAGTVHSPRPHTVTGQTATGELVTFEVRVYQAGQW
jgi:hypothetical protein